MNDLAVGRVVRAVRLRKRWRQLDVSTAARVSQQTVSALKRGQLDDFTLRTLRHIAKVLEIDLPLTPRWRGPELERLLDAAHASMVDSVVAVLRACGWETLVEWSFNHFGERGAVDVVGWHAATRTLLVIEVKTAIVDVQDLLAKHDRKVRIAVTTLAVERGWQAAAVGRVLVVSDTSTNRRHVRARGSTFRAVMPAGTSAIRRWLAGPQGSIAGTWFMSPTADGSTRKACRAKQRSDRACDLRAFGTACHPPPRGVDDEERFLATPGGRN